MSSRTNFVPSFPNSSARPVTSDELRDRLRRTAKYQRWVLLALLANITLSVIVLVNVFELAAIPSPVLRIIGYVRLPICLFMTVAIFLLATQFFHIAVVIVCGLLMWVPFVSLITLLIVNAKATRFLQLYGVKVGLLGADYRKV